MGPTTLEFFELHQGDAMAIGYVLDAWQKITQLTQQDTFLRLLEVSTKGFPNCNQFAQYLLLSVMPHLVSGTKVPA